MSLPGNTSYNLPVKFALILNSGQAYSLGIGKVESGVIRFEKGLYTRNDLPANTSTVNGRLILVDRDITQTVQNKGLEDIVNNTKDLYGLKLCITC